MSEQRKTCATCDYWRKGDTTDVARPIDRWGSCGRMSVGRNGHQPAVEVAVILVPDIGGPGWVKAGAYEEARFETFKDFGCASWWEREPRR